MKDIQATDRLAIDQYLDSLHWQEQKKPGVHEALVSLANRERKDYRTVKREVLVAAVQLVIMQRTEAQPIRIGEKWVGGGHTPVIPLSLDEQDFAAWFAQETRKAAFAITLGQPYPDTGADADYREYQALLKHINSSSREWDGKKETLYFRTDGAYGDDGDDDRGWYSDDHVAMRRLLEELPARDRSLLNSLAEKKTPAQIAQETGRSAGAVRTELARLRPRLKERHAELREDAWDWQGDQWRNPVREETAYDKQCHVVREAAKEEAQKRWDEECARDPIFAGSQRVQYAKENSHLELVVRFKRINNRQKKITPDKFPELTRQEMEKCLQEISMVTKRWWIWRETDRIAEPRLPRRLD